MIKYWLKNRLIYDLIISVVMALLFCFAFVYQANDAYKKVKEDNSIYVNSEIDFQIPNPSVDQLIDIKNETFVDDVFGYYLTKTNVIGKNSSKINLIMSDTMSSLSFTMYNDKTKIDSITQSGITNYAYIDKIAADALNVSIGDDIVISIASNTLTYRISTIYEANPLFKEGSIVLEFSGEIKEIYDANVSSKGYSAAFIKAFSISECSNYLMSYKPLGRLKDRSEFDTDEAYNAYNDAIMSGNYSNEITDFREKRINANKEIDSAKSKLTTMAYVGAAVIAVALIALVLILRFRKSEKNYFKNVLNNKKGIVVYRTCSLGIGLVLFGGLTCILQAIFGNFTMIIIPIIIVLLTYILIYILNLILDKSYIK